jgi:hypothetical protein
MRYAMSFDQIQRELTAIIGFDALFLNSRADYYPDEIVGFECRQKRERELLDMVKSRTLKNQSVVVTGQ